MLFLRHSVVQIRQVYTLIGKVWEDLSSWHSFVSVEDGLSDVALERRIDFRSTKHQQTNCVIKIQNVVWRQPIKHTIPL